MKTKEQIMEAIRQDKALMKKIKEQRYYDEEQFYDDVLRYIKAIREGRMLNTIKSVSSSGMSRTMKFVEVSKNDRTGRYNVMTFWGLFKVLGYRESRGYSNAFSVSGCGMDMVFHTNYTNVRNFYHLGFLDRDEADYLCQQTPTTI